jgi:hypothetical protein
VMNRNKEKWSQGAIRQSNALDLEGGVFMLSEPRKIAESQPVTHCDTKAPRIIEVARRIEARFHGDPSPGEVTFPV